jgi:hypothetical protein
MRRPDASSYPVDAVDQRSELVDYALCLSYGILDPGGVRVSPPSSMGNLPLDKSSERGARGCRS